MREFRSYGSVRGAPINGRPYRETASVNSWPLWDLCASIEIQLKPDIESIAVGMPITVAPRAAQVLRPQ